MADVKVSASFILQGRVLPAEQPCSKKGKKKKEEKEKNENFYHQETIRLRNNKPIVINVRNDIPAKQARSA